MTGNKTETESKEVSELGEILTAKKNKQAQTVADIEATGKAKYVATLELCQQISEIEKPYSAKLDELEAKRSKLWSDINELESKYEDAKWGNVDVIPDEPKEINKWLRNAKCVEGAIKHTGLSMDNYFMGDNTPNWKDDGEILRIGGKFDSEVLYIHYTNDRHVKEWLLVCKPSHAGDYTTTYSNVAGWREGKKPYATWKAMIGVV